MRCRPNDIAIVVGTNTENDGRYVKLLAASADQWLLNSCVNAGHWWSCQALTRITVWRGGRGPERIEPPGSTVDFPDCNLRPIRDPGDDAIDQFARERDDVRELLAPKRQVEFTR